MAKRGRKPKTRTQKEPKRTLAEALERTNETSTVAAPAVSPIQHMTAQQLAMIAILWLVAHSAIIYLANRWFPDAVVLGTNVITPTMAILYSMVVFTLITVGAIPVIEALSTQLRWRLSNLHWFALFALVDVVGIWLVARFAEQLGMGISSWTVALTLGLVMDVTQGVLVKVANPQS